MMGCNVHSPNVSKRQQLFLSCKGFPNRIPPRHGFCHVSELGLLIPHGWLGGWDLVIKAGGLEESNRPREKEIAEIEKLYSVKHQYYAIIHLEAKKIYSHSR